MRTRWCLALLLYVAWMAAWAAGDPQDQLDRLQAFVAQVSERVEQLQQELARAERRNAEQSKLIERLERRLAEQEKRDPGEQRRQRQRFFALLADRLKASPVYQVQADRVIVPADLVFIFSRGRLGAEGEERLAPLAEALREAVAELPGDRPWRLRVEGHTDRRPLRNNREFPTNWELSAARATEVVRYLIRKGLPEDHLEAVALAATRPLSRGRSRADYRRNRRIELHLVFPQP